MNLEMADRITGGASRPSKMPGLSWNIPATLCKVGSKLRNVPNSTCSGCYALKGRYMFPNVQNAMNKRLDLYNKAHENGTITRWYEAMAYYANSRRSKRFFRFFDSGDLQSLQMLHDLCIVAQMAPNTKFWLPTREYGIVREFVRGGYRVPDNMVIRLSSPMVDAFTYPHITGWGITYSAVHTNAPTTGAFVCPANTQEGKCGDCRVCWSSKSLLVSYPKH